jgi:hypothetical protein
MVVANSAPAAAAVMAVANSARAAAAVMVVANSAPAAAPLPPDISPNEVQDIMKKHPGVEDSSMAQYKVAQNKHFRAFCAAAGWDFEKSKRFVDAEGVVADGTMRQFAVHLDKIKTTYSSASMLCHACKPCFFMRVNHASSCV